MNHVRYSKEMRSNYLTFVTVCFSDNPSRNFCVQLLSNKVLALTIWVLRSMQRMLSARKRLWSIYIFSNPWLYPWFVA